MFKSVRTWTGYFGVDHNSGRDITTPVTVAVRCGEES